MRIGLVGLGKWGRNYIKEIEKFPNLNLIIACRKTPSRPDFLPANCIFTANYQELLFHNLDGVIVATDNVFEIIRVFLDHNIPVLAEKPLIINNDTELINKYKNHKILVNYIHLFSPAFIKLKLIINNSKINRIYSEGFNAGPNRKFSSLYDYGCHDLSMILNLIGKENLKDSYINLYNRNMIGELYNIGLLTDGGLHNSLVGNGSIWRRRRITVYTDKDEAVYDDYDANKLYLNKKPILFDNSVSPLENTLKSFIDLMNEKKDDRFGIGLSVKIAEILETYQGNK